jgi:hypothetical protein
VIGDQQIDWDGTGGRAGVQMAGTDSCERPGQRVIQIVKRGA